MAPKSSEQPRGKLSLTLSTLLVSQLLDQPRRIWGKRARKPGVGFGRISPRLTGIFGPSAAMRAQCEPTGAESSCGAQEEVK